MNDLLVREIIEEVVREADEVLYSKVKSEYDEGQLLAYANVLGIIKSMLSDRADEYGLDYDIDRKYLCRGN